MAGLLDRTVRRWAAGRFCWRSENCGQEVLAYAAAAVGRAAPALPPIAGERAARRLVHREGGLVNYSAQLMAELGCPPTSAPERGDVGVIDVPGSGETCAICLGRNWMVKGQGGVTMFEPPAGTVLAAWEVRPCRRP